MSVTKARVALSISAAVIGAMIIQTIDTGILLAGFPSEYNLVIKAVLVIFILVLQSPNITGDLKYLRQKLLARKTAQEAGE